MWKIPHRRIIFTRKNINKNEFSDGTHLFCDIWRSQSGIFHLDIIKTTSYIAFFYSAAYNFID